MTRTFAGQSRGRQSADPSAPCHRACARCSDFPAAFSLVEMMIAIVILGLGLVMVATVFPVAWGRARELSEHSIEKSIVDGAHATLQSLLRPTGVEIVLPFNEVRLNSGGLAGDLFFDPTIPPDPDVGSDERHLAVLAYSDTRVHALHLTNMLANPGSVPGGDSPVAEEPWKVERLFQLVNGVFWNQRYPDPKFPRKLGPDFDLGDNKSGSAFYYPQVEIRERVHPPLDSQPPDTAPEEVRNAWRDKLFGRRFCWAVLHRLQSPVGPQAPISTPVSPAESSAIAAEAATAMGYTRTFDTYYVTLRRPQSTNRYARQDTALNGLPNPDDRATVVAPKARTPDDDVMFPVAWRVQVQFPTSLASSAPGSPNPPTGVPTEVLVPPKDMRGNEADRAMLVGMFPTGTQFVDEVNGLVYRVTKRRITKAVGDEASLTLDREVLLDDIDDGQEWGNHALEEDEWLRTVWVFPPPVDRSAGGNVPVFEGSSPVVGMQVRTLTLVPSS